MGTPCPRCGTLKTEYVRHGYIYNILWKMGYHLRRCSFCNRRRLIKRGDRNRPHPNDLTAEELTEHFNRKIASALRRDAAASGVIVKNMTLDSAPQSPGLGPRPKATAVGVAEVEAKNDYGLCPKCGNAKYRRSRRPAIGRQTSQAELTRPLTPAAPKGLIPVRFDPRIEWCDVMRLLCYSAVRNSISFQIFSNTKNGKPQTKANCAYVCYPARNCS
jgi:hypothetical protein